MTEATNGHLKDKPAEEDQPLVSPDQENGVEEEIEVIELGLGSPGLGSIYSLKSSSIIESSTKRGIITFLESFMGTGILALPYVFNDVGLVPAWILLFMIGCINYYTMRLVHTVATDLKIGKVDYGRLMERATRRQSLRYFAEWNLHILQIGAIIPSLVYIFQYFNKMACLYEWSMFCGVKWAQALVILAFVIPIGSVTHIHHMAIPSGIALIFQLLFFAIFLVISISTLQVLGKNGSISKADFFEFNPSKLPISFATMLFAYEGIGLLLEVRSSVGDNKKFAKVIQWTFIGCTTLYLVFGTIGKLAYGDAVEPLIFMNLDQTDGLIVFVEVMYLFGLVIAIPSGLFPVLRIVESWDIFRDFLADKETGKKAKFKRVLLKLPIILFVTLIAMLVPSFELVLGLLGGLNFTTLDFVVPVLLYNFHFRKNPQKRFMRWANWCLLLVGTAIGILATIQSVYEMAVYDKLG